MRYDIASITHVGKVRQNNQDRVLAMVGDGAALLAVADGMGGLAHGERASAITAEVLTRWWQQNTLSDLSQLSAALDAAIYEAHREIYYFSETQQQRTGSTLSLLYLQGERYLIKQIGDSRVYYQADGAVRQLTTDQTWSNRMIERGELSPAAAHQHRLCNALVNALGASEELEIATLTGAARKGESFLLCSDGFYHEAPIRRLAADLKKTAAETALQTLLAEVLAGPARDNASAVLCRLL